MFIVVVVEAVRFLFVLVMNARREAGVGGSGHGEG